MIPCIRSQTRPGKFENVNGQKMSQICQQLRRYKDM